VRCDIAELLPSVTMLSLRLLMSQDCDGDNVQCLVVRCDIAELLPTVTMLSLRLLVSQDCDGDSVQCLVAVS